MELSVSDYPRATSSEITVLWDEIQRVGAFSFKEAMRLAPITKYISALFHAKTTSYAFSCSDLSPAFILKNREQRDEIYQLIHNAAWCALHSDNYKLEHNNKPLLESFELGLVATEEWKPVFELDRALYVRDGQPQAYSTARAAMVAERVAATAALEANNARLEAERLEALPIWDREPDIYGDDVLPWEKIYICYPPYLNPSPKGLAEWDENQCPF